MFSLDLYRMWSLHTQLECVLSKSLSLCGAGQHSNQRVWIYGKGRMYSLYTYICVLSKYLYTYIARVLSTSLYTYICVLSKSGQHPNERVWIWQRSCGRHDLLGGGSTCNQQGDGARRGPLSQLQDRRGKKHGT